jgi:signal transduction histidine kinase
MAVQLHARRCQGPSGDASLDVALRQLALCEQQVKGLLTTDRIEPGERTRFDAAEILAEVAALVGPLALHRRIDLNVSVENVLILHLDREALRSALLNLAQNAIEATGPGGRVELVAEEDGNLARFDVLDDGPGPPPEITPTIFDPFVTGKSEGIGLGLVVARRVAEGLQGSLTWSRADDRTLFRLEFPTSPPSKEGPA